MNPTKSSGSPMRPRPATSEPNASEKPTSDPDDAHQREPEEAVHDRRQDVLAADEAAVEQGEPRQHHHDQRGRHEHPGRVAAVDGERCRRPRGRVRAGRPAGSWPPGRRRAVSLRFPSPDPPPSSAVGFRSPNRRVGRTLGPIRRPVSAPERCAGVPFWVDGRLPHGYAGHDAVPTITPGNAPPDAPGAAPRGGTAGRR